MDTGQNDISKMSRVFLPLSRRAYGGEKEKEKEKIAEKIETARYVTDPPAGLGKINREIRCPGWVHNSRRLGISPKRKDARGENVVSDSAFRPG